LREGHDFSRADKLLRLVPRFSAWGWLFAPRHRLAAEKRTSVAEAAPRRPVRHD